MAQKGNGPKLLLALKEKPSFQGELSIDLVEENDSEGHAKYSLICQKKPPFNEVEWALFVGVLGGVVGKDLDEITKNIGWQQEVPAAEATEILDILQRQIAPVVPETSVGLDGTFYELHIERGFSSVQFTWWCEPPQVWSALGEAAKTLLKRADAASMVEARQSKTRKQLIEQLEEQLGELQAKMKKDSGQLMRTHNDRCDELERSLRTTGLTCPGCGQHSKDIRFIDKSPDAKSYFICRACGRSFRPEDLALSDHEDRNSLK
jgi:hypothetical protein